jgi:hypothetical protein
LAAAGPPLIDTPRLSLALVALEAARERIALMPASAWALTRDVILQSTDPRVLTSKDGAGTQQERFGAKRKC